MDMEDDIDDHRQPEMLTEQELINQEEDLEFEDDYDDEWEDEVAEKSSSENS